MAGEDRHGVAKTGLCLFHSVPGLSSMEYRVLFCTQCGCWWNHSRVEMKGDIFPEAWFLATHTLISLSYAIFR